MSSHSPELNYFLGIKCAVQTAGVIGDDFLCFVEILLSALRIPGRRALVVGRALAAHIRDLPVLAHGMGPGGVLVTHANSRNPRLLDCSGDWTWVPGGSVPSRGRHSLLLGHH